MKSMLKKVLKTVTGDREGLSAELRGLKLQMAQQAAALEKALVLLGELRSAQLAAAAPESLADYEFRAFSQFGDDGIISHLIDTVRPDVPVFVEFGVESYVEANTRYLLLSRNWRGLVMDGSKNNVDAINQSSLAWRHSLTARAEFVTAENINDLLSANGFTGKIGLLHIDIDGNDYWVWKAITVCDADIVIVEFNSGFGAERAITVPYSPDFVRSKAHPSNLYYGASVRALAELADSKGYDFVGCNSAGNNAYFVKRPLPAGVKALTPEAGYVRSRFRETRDSEGRLLFKTASEGFNLIRGLPVFNTTTGTIEKL